MSDLAERVHAGIGSTRRHDGRRFRLKPAQCVFDGLLNRKTILLSLPPDKLAAVIFDFKRVAIHE